MRKNNRKHFLKMKEVEGDEESKSAYKRAVNVRIGPPIGAGVVPA
jgi:hypothetical protein